MSKIYKIEAYIVDPNDEFTDGDAILKNYITAQKHYKKCYLLSTNAIKILNE